MAATAIGSIDLIKSLGLTFAQQNGITNIWELIPPEKQTLYRCAYQVIKAANDAFPEPEGRKGDALTWWRMGHAHKLLSAFDAMTEWSGSTESRTAYVVQKISDWFAKHGWEHLKAPLLELLRRAIEYHNAGIELKRKRIEEEKEREKKNGGRK